MRLLKRIFSWQAVLGIILVALSAVFYTLHYMIFRDAHHIFIYLVGDIAFVFIEVLMVAIVLHRLLIFMEKKDRVKKLNMVVGLFYSEMGTELIRFFSEFDKNSVKLAGEFVELKKWSGKEYAKMKKHVAKHTCDPDCKISRINELKKFLHSKKEFMLMLLENPTLLEHEAFTDLLWSVFHLAEELSHRHNFDDLPETDYNHISGDIKRVYNLLVIEWIAYMKHLKTEYPYLFSLALRTNPFNPDASAVVRE